MLSKYDRIRAFLAENHDPDYRFQQVTKAIFAQRAPTFSGITTLPRELRTALAERFGDDVLSIQAIAERRSPQTRLMLFQLSDGHRIEAVAMRYRKGWNSLCISSQSGCGLGCSFCATGALGLKRNLSADEISDQVLYFHLQGMKVDSISFMGMGEALANPATFEALRLLTDEQLFGLGPRRLTVSTVGVIPGIRRLTRGHPQVNLTFSLHSPFNEQRSELIPLNDKYPIEAVFATLDEHARRTRRKVYIAYLLLAGVNDTLAHARALAARIQRRGEWTYLYHVNLIRYNPAVNVPVPYRRPDEKAVRRFKGELQRAGVPVTVRGSFGVEIDAACGQLYGRYVLERP